MFVYVAEVSDVDLTGLDCFVDGAAVVTESFAVDVAAVRGEGLFTGGTPRNRSQGRVGSIGS